MVNCKWNRHLSMWPYFSHQTYRPRTRQWETDGTLHETDGSMSENRTGCLATAYKWIITELTYRGNRVSFFFFFQCHHMSFVDFVVLPPGHGRSVTDFWGWDAHEAQLRCPNGVWVVTEDDVVPGGALNLNSTNVPRPWSPGESSPSRKIPMVEPGIEPGTSWLVIRDSDH